MKSFRNNKLFFSTPLPGYMALISVVIIGAVASAIAVTMLMTGVGAVRTGGAVQQTAQAVANANTCAEYGLQQLRQSSSYGGNTTLTLAQGSCQLLQITGSGTKTVQVIGHVGDATRKVQLTVQMSPFQILTWQELADF